jgi:hypothetical protein
VNSDTYRIPAQLPWSAFAGSIKRAEDALARLDERLRTHPLAEGWAERAHFAEACAKASSHPLSTRDTEAALGFDTAACSTSSAGLARSSAIEGADTPAAKLAPAFSALARDGASPSALWMPRWITISRAKE